MAIYLDYAAATPLDDQALAAMQPYLSERFYNPSATYLAAKAVRQDIDAARARVAQVLGARPADIIFTAGGTEAKNLALQGVLQQFPGRRLLASAIEHASVLALGQTYPLTTVPVHADGLLDVGALERSITDDTVLVSVMYANNEVGTIQPLREVAAVMRQVLVARRRAGNRMPLWLHSDATQAANYLDLHVARLGVDLLTINGGKIYGPKQTGVLYASPHVTLQPLLHGGGQERNLRSGTENVPGIMGFSAALARSQALRHDEGARLQGLQRQFIDLLQARIPGVVINGSLKKRLPNNVHLTLPGQDNERVLMALDEAGIQAAAGSACAASDDEPSHVLAAMGISAADAQASLRFTMGRGTTAADVATTVDVLGRLIA